MNTLVFLRSPLVPVFWPSMGLVGTVFTVKPCRRAMAQRRLRFSCAGNDVMLRVAAGGAWLVGSPAHSSHDGATRRTACPLLPGHPPRLLQPMARLCQMQAPLHAPWHGAGGDRQGRRFQGCPQAPGCIVGRDRGGQLHTSMATAALIWRPAALRRCCSAWERLLTGALRAGCTLGRAPSTLWVADGKTEG